MLSPVECHNFAEAPKHRILETELNVNTGCLQMNGALHCTLHCNHRSGHLKTEHTESLFLLRRHLGNLPRSPAVSMKSELLVAHEKLGQLPLLTVYVLPV